MTDRTTRDTPEPNLPAPVTGIARGSEGTATNLDDTQVYDVSTFDVPAEPEPIDHAPLDDEPIVGKPVVAPPIVAAPVATAPAGSMVRAPRPVASRTGRGTELPLAIRAGLITAVIALAVLFGASLTRSPGIGQDIGQGGPGITTAPSAAPTDASHDDGDGEGGAKDHGNGCGNGKGNGNNC
jgi:hypothetical protein